MSSQPTTQTSLSPSIRAILDLFEGPLAEVRFPGVERESLARAEAEVESRRAELQRALEAVASARESLESAQAALLEQARRAHGYATVFADGDPALTEALAKVEFEGRALAPKKTRGRPAKPRPTKHQTSLTVADDAA
jgi:multidrug efflux pump subunit AcrA (membrane-fusion protein)